jgi:ABC-type polysaccharide/polyol phosphate export permease
MNSNPEIYDSSKRRNPLIEEALVLFKYRNLLYQFVTTSIKTRYKRSMLGVVWTLLNPLLTMLILTVVFSQVFRITLDNYPVYVLSGLVVWNFFSATTSQAMVGMAMGGSLLQRIYVPKSVFAVSAIGVGLVNLGLSVIPLFLIGIFLRTPVTPAILVMPFAVLLLILFSLGVGLILETAAVYFADLLPFYEVLLMLWMYTTPIIYPLEILSPRLQSLFKLNPMYHFVTLFRTPIYAGVIPPLNEWLTAGAFAVGAFVLGSLIFTAKSNEYAYRT